MLTDQDLNRHVGRYYGKYSGTVKEFGDDQKRGHIKVTVPGVFGPDLVVEARPCMPFGHFFVPAAGTQVWIEFEAGDPRFPLWVGAWYPDGKSPKEAAIDPPENRVIQTPSGHTVEFLDKEGEEKILIRHKGNAFITIDKKGSVLVANQKGSHIFLDADGGKVTVMEEHGNIVVMSENGLSLVNDAGTLVELKDDTARVAAKNIILQGTTVALGAQAAEPTIMGATFAAAWTAFGLHTHATAVGPTGPPVPVAQPLTPGSGLTTSVVVK